MLDILIPTFMRPEALAVTLCSLLWQDLRPFKVIISDQSPSAESSSSPAVTAVVRLMRAKGIAVELITHLPAKGIAENRAFLLSRSGAARCLFLDDDLILEPDLVGRLVAVLDAERCGFVGSAPIGLSFIDDIRPHEQAIEFWERRVAPEKVRPDTPQWQRHRLHNAANIFHLQNRLGLTPRTQRLYKVAWIGSCVLFDSDKLREIGGFGFWEKLPREVCGEDVYVQLRMMEKYGGCGIIPSGVYHQELSTTIPNRDNNALRLLKLYPSRPINPSSAKL